MANLGKICKHLRSTINPIFQRKFSTKMVSSNELPQFLATFPVIVQDLTNDKKYADVPQVKSHVLDLLNYVKSGGKKVRGLITVEAYKMLEKKENLTPENIKLANIMGWIVEMTHVSLLIHDDIMDKSQTRRGVPCWYLKPNIGLNAINDGILIEESIYHLLEKYFSKHSCLLPAYRILHKAWMITTIGESQDIMCIMNGKTDFGLFTVDTYRSLIRRKAIYYTVNLPVALAMSLANIYDDKNHDETNDILLEIGEFGQIENDFLDCFGDPEITGKNGTDISEGRCNWLAVQALQRADLNQKKLMEKYYGSSDPEAERIIRNLYEKLSLREAFATYKETSYNRIRNRIEKTSNEPLRKLFSRLLQAFYRRNFESVN